MLTNRSSFVLTIALALQPGCTVFGDCIDWKFEGNCTPNDDEAGDPIVEGIHYCAEGTGNCLLSQLAEPFAGFFRGDPHTGTCDLAVSMYPCGDFTIPSGVDPIVSGETNLEAFEHTCGTCPDARTTVDDPAFFQGAVQATGPLGDTFGCTLENPVAAGEYLAFGNGIAPSWNGSEGVDGIECRFDEPEYPISRPWCGFGDQWCTGLCDSDADCESMEPYMTTLIGPGEAQCAGWPMASNYSAASGQVEERAHGCVWNTGGLVIPPAPIFGGMLVEHGLTCIDNVCDIDEALIDYAFAHLSESAIGLDWVGSQDGSIDLTVQSYAYANYLGLQTGDRLVAVGLSAQPITAGSIATTIEELADGETGFQVLRGRDRIEFIITVVGD